MFKKMSFLALIVAAAFFAVGCNMGEESPKKPELQMGELEYEIIDRNSEVFGGLYEDEDFQNWYDSSLRQEGASSVDIDEERYILLSAGEKDTGGYSIENIVLTGKEEEIEVKADLKVPSDDTAVVHALSYPHVLLSAPKDERKVVFTDFNKVEYQVQQEFYQDTGRYVGQIDSNSVEIEISGVPEEMAARAFRLDGDLKEDFEEKHGLQTGDEVSFTYFIDEYQRNILVEIKKL